jgi:hypothetical protein
MKIKLLTISIYVHPQLETPLRDHYIPNTSKFLPNWHELLPISDNADHYLLIHQIHQNSFQTDIDINSKLLPISDHAISRLNTIWNTYIKSFHNENKSPPYQEQSEILTLNPSIMKIKLLPDYAIPQLKFPPFSLNRFILLEQNGNKIHFPSILPDLLMRPWETNSP